MTVYLKRCLMLWVLLVSSFPAWAGAPRIACDSTEYRFGRADNGGSVERDFVIHNRGDAPLKLGKLRACCGASMNVATNVIAPGTNTILHVKLSLKGRRGKQRKSFYVASNDKRQPYLQLRFLGEAIAEVTVRPRKVNFGSIEPDARLEKESVISYATNVVLNVTNVVSGSERFVASLVSLSSNNQHRIKVTTVPPFPAGTSWGRITVLTDHPKHKKLTIRTMAKVVEDMVVVPKEIVLIAADGEAKPVTRYIAIRSRKKRKFEILEVKVPQDGIVARCSAQGEFGYRIELTDMLAISGDEEREIVIRIESEKGEEQELLVPLRVVEREGKKPSP